MESLLAYALGFLDFFTAVFGFASAFPFASPPVFFAATKGGRAARGLAWGAAELPVSDAVLAAAIGSGFASGALSAGLGVAFFTFFAARTSSAVGAGGATGWSPLAITSPLYTQHLMPITPYVVFASAVP